MAYITVCTPTYNRGYILHRPFESLMQQTFKDFEWLVVDDGSTDNTEEIVYSFAQTADFSVRYVKKENGGRASALNESYHHITTDYVCNLDSDDAFLPDALQKMHDIWEGIPEEERRRFWCLTGHCVDSVTGKQIGPAWPKWINRLSGKRQHKWLTIYKGGDKFCCRKTAVLRQFPFPQYSDTKFVPENIVWEEINQHYDQYCVNEILCLYYTDSTDSLSRGAAYSITRKRSYYYLSRFYLNNCFYQIGYNRWVRRAPLDIVRLAYVTERRYRDVMKDINKWYKRALVSLVWIPVRAFSKMYYSKNIKGT